MELDELRRLRRELNDAVLVHAESVRVFREANKPWFRLTIAGEREKAKLQPRHLSTTASCLESLRDCRPAEHRLVDRADDELASSFGSGALKVSPNNKENWQSEDAAYIYCRVRTLPAIIEMAPEAATKYQAKLRLLIQQVWDRVEPDNLRQQGVSEADIYDPETDPRFGYPPNAFHTFWALKLLKAYEGADLRPLRLKDIEQRRMVALLWARKEMAEHAALLGSDPAAADSQQMAWALSADVVSHEGELTAASDRYPTYKATLDAFFGAQQISGGWPKSRPLFHYPKAGNAYCYTFETLAAVLRPALPRETGRAYRELLRPHAERLVRSYNLAIRTRVQLQRSADGQPLYGWSSGHHPHRLVAEAWATASVYSFIQLLRCIVGHWTAEAAATTLRVRTGKLTHHDDALRTLAERGDSWVRGEEEQTVARRLAALFVHPRSADIRDSNQIDSDMELVADNEARSAILFGPPGASKTTLVEAVASAIGWQFVEVLAADFLSDGMDKVPARADAIFARLMELDRCVILFDEIDELIRHRDDSETDPFGRFLTTSMLPKIAQLYKQRRVLFFVATNHIERADPAIRRSQRFDATILVMPPSFRRKCARLQALLKQPLPSKLTLEEVASALSNDHGTPETNPLGIFALLRWDQLDELAAKLDSVEVAAANSTLEAELGRMGEQLERLEWHHEDGGPYQLLRNYEEENRQDFGKRLAIRVVGDLSGPPVGALDSEPLRREGKEAYWAVHGWDGLKHQEDGQLRLHAGAFDAGDNFVLSFEDPQAETSLGG